MLLHADDTTRLSESVDEEEWTIDHIDHVDHVDTLNYN